MTTQPNTPIQERDDRPKALRYRDQLDAVEQMIVDALPDITRKLIAMAKDGDLAAARYLYDRIGGRPARLTTPPNSDQSLPFTCHDWSLDLLRQKDNHDSKAEIYMRSILARDASAIPGIRTPASTTLSLDKIRSQISPRR